MWNKKNVVSLQSKLNQKIWIQQTKLIY